MVSSCGTGLKISSDKLSGINSNFKGTFQNNPHKKASKKGTPSDSDILELLNILNKKSDSVSVSFISNKLVIKYDDILGKSAAYFDGKFSEKGYYEIYFSKKNIQIPPLLPIFYSKVDIDRIRISLTQENELIIDSYYSRGGNIFLMAAGGSGRSQFYFKSTK
ncbi:hypothetical protein B0I10_11439 [Flavobacterium lacus]|uniref:Uncharacterized protein n=2 Tax=Flavobacterium lacus TaxID=1353778 RepID=A0A328WKD5_9FLAO|nr:hypothetical protein B0I10_11439 [Flavobacterium lacus]